MKKLLLSLFVACLTIFSAAAATITVTQITDDGTGTATGSLSQAINTAIDGDVIAFNLSSGDVITLSAALPTITKTLTINGTNIATGNRVTIQVASPGVSPFRVFTIVPTVAGKTIELNDLNLRGGDVSGLSENGGVINLSNATMNLNRCVIRDGKAVKGGGISAVNSTIKQCTISNNTASTSGGGIYGQRITILNSTISANVAVSYGGINLFNYNLVMNTTISGNTATTAYTGGMNPPHYYLNGIVNPRNLSYWVIINNIVINNTGDDGVANIIRSDYIWCNIADPSNPSNIKTAYNTGDLGSLNNNGGPTPTMELSSSAPAYHSGIYIYYNTTDGYYKKNTDNTYSKFTSTSRTGYASFTPSSANPENDKITTDQRGATRSTTPSMGAYDGISEIPEIDVKQGSTSIADGTDSYDFGSQTTSTNTDVDFTIENTGTATSTLGTFTITGTNANQFSFQGTNPTTVAALTGSSTFTVRFTPTSAGAKTATVSFANQDANENPYDFTITGNGVASPTIGSFTPTSAGTGTTITITGANFTGATAVSFGGTAATSFNVVNATTITAVVASGTTGTISVVTPGGTATSSGNFTFAQPMQLKFTTTGASQSIALPLYGTVNCTVNWGDNTATEDFTTTGLKPHTFAAAGIHTVSISGRLTRFGDEVNGWIGAGYLTEVVDFGTVGLTALWGAFINANNLTSVPATLPATVTNLQYTFKNNGRVTIANLNLWDVGNVTDMLSMFENATAFNQSLATWDVSSVGNMDYMFSGASSFDQNLGSWNIEQVLGMEDMFKGVTLSPANYDALLTGWAALTAQNGVTFNGGNSKYTCGAASARQSLITDDEWTIIDGGALLITWDGSESSDWNVAANWSCNAVPTETDNVLIPDVARDPIVDLAAASPAVCKDLTIESVAVLTIPAGKALTVNGTLTNNAGITGLVVQSASAASDGTGSLINGTAGVLGTVERYVSGNLWHLISPSATAGERVIDFVGAAQNANLIARNGTNYALAPWIENTGKWAYYKVAGSNTGQFGSPSQGFQVLRATNAGTGTGGGVDGGKLTFKGTLAAANLNIPVTKSLYGWNLVGNPYPCALDIAKFVTANTALLDPSYVAIYVSNIGDVATKGYSPVLGADGLKLASGEGFFVKAKTGGGNISFTTAMKSNVADAFKAATIDGPVIRLTAEDGNAKLGTTVEYIEGATKGLDPGKDAGLFDGTASSFKLFTRLIEDNGVDFTIQALPDNNLGSMVVPVGLVADKGAMVTFKAMATNLPAGYKVVLEDKETNTFTRLDEANSSYIVSLAAATLGTGRFYLHTTEIVSAIDESLLSAVKVVPIPEQHLVRIIGNFDLPTKAMVYDMNGKLVATSMLASQIENEIPLTNCATGVYLLKIDSGKDVENVKFVWKRK